MARYNETTEVTEVMLGQLSQQLRVIAEQIDGHRQTMLKHDMQQVDVLLWLTTLDASHNLSRFSGKIAQAIATKSGPITEEVKASMDARRGRKTSRRKK